MSEEPQFMAVGSQDAAFQKTIRDAQSTLDQFRRLLPRLIGTEAYPSIKACLTCGEDRVNIWLTVEVAGESDFIATLFEVPSEFEDYNVGDAVRVPCDAVLDWMYHDQGTLHGGFSLRYQRSLLPTEEHAAFDERLGVERYA